MLADGQLGAAGQARGLRLAAVRAPVRPQRVEKNAAELLTLSLVDVSEGIGINLDAVAGMRLVRLGYRLQRTVGLLEVEIADGHLGLGAGGDALDPALEIIFPGALGARRGVGIE